MVLYLFFFLSIVGRDYFESSLANVKARLANMRIIVDGRFINIEKVTLGSAAY